MIVDVKVQVLDDADVTVALRDIVKRNVGHLRRLLYVRTLWTLLGLLGAILFPLVCSATTFGPEVAIAAPEFGLAVGEQVASSLACNDQSCLAVWFGLSNTAGLYSSVIDADGTVHPTASNLLRSGFQGSSSLVWTGDHYLAVWNDGATRTLVAAPLSRDGLLTGALQSLTNFPENVPPNAVAWNGRHALVVFSTPGGLQGTLLDANGNLVRSFAVSSQQTSVYAVAAAGATFGVLWLATTATSQVATAYMERFDDGGAPLDALPITPATNLKFLMGLASNGSQFGAALVGLDSGSLQRVRIDAATGAVDTLPATSFIVNFTLGVYWSGDDFVAYAADVNNVDTQQFTSDAVRVLDISPKFLTAPQIVQGPSGALATWIDGRPTGTDQHLLGALLDRDATTIRLRDLAVARSAVPQTRPALAPSPSGALLVWQLDRDDEIADTYATRLDRAGHPIDSTPILLSHSGAGNDGRAVLWLGDSYLVVFPSAVSMVGKRISPSGAVLDSDPIVFGNGYLVALASNGATTILVMVDQNFTIRVLRLNAAGTVMDSQTIARSSSIAYLAAATNGAEFVIAWSEDHSDFETPRSDIYAVRLTASGVPMDASPIAIAHVNSIDESVEVASDGRDFLFAYTDVFNVSIKRLLREGTVVTGIFFASSSASEPRVNFAGDRYFLMWTELGVARAATLDKTGNVIDPPSVFAQSDSGYQVQKALVPGLVAYSRGAAAEGGIAQMYTRQIVFPPIRGRAVRH